MKFFTLQWYRKDKDEAQYSEAFDSYLQHLEVMKGVLPASVIELANLPGVDDGLIAEVRHDRLRRRLTLVLRCGHLQMGYYDLVLNYEGAEISKSDEWKLACLAKISQGDRAPDIAYHEVDSSGSGVEHRILFHGGGWFAIRCQELSWAKIEVPDRVLPTISKRFPGGPGVNFYGMKNRKSFEGRNMRVRVTKRVRRNRMKRGRAT